MSSLDQWVTQWMSVRMSSIPSARTSSHDHSCTAPVSVRTENCHSSGSMIGVPLAESTGQSATVVCPGGSRGSTSRRRPPNPLVKVAMSQIGRAHV